MFDPRKNDPTYDWYDPSTQNPYTNWDPTTMKFSSTPTEGSLGVYTNPDDFDSNKEFLDAWGQAALTNYGDYYGSSNDLVRTGPSQYAAPVDPGTGTGTGTGTGGGTLPGVGEFGYVDPNAPPGYYDELYTDLTTGETYVIHKDAQGNMIGSDPYTAPAGPEDELSSGGYDTSSLESTIQAIQDAASGANLGDIASRYSANYDKFTGGLASLTNRINQMDMYDPTAQMDQIAGLSSDLQTGGDGQWQLDARDETAKNLGYNTWDEFQTAQTGRRDATREGMTGLTEEESASYDKMIRQTMADMERRSMAQVEAVFANTGSSIQYMQAADEANQSMVNQQTKMQFEQMNQNIALQMEELRRNDEKYFKQMEAGTLGVTEYMRAKENAVMGAINGYVQQASLGMQADATEIQAIVAQADSIYKGAMTQLGIDQGILDLTQQWFDTNVQPLMTVLEAQLADANLEAMGEANEAAILGSVIGAVGEIGAALIPW